MNIQVVHSSGKTITFQDVQQISLTKTDGKRETLTNPANFNLLYQLQNSGELASFSVLSNGYSEWSTTYSAKDLIPVE